MMHSYNDGEKFRAAKSDAQSMANQTGEFYMSGYDSWAGWTFSKYHETQSFELTELTIHKPENVMEIEFNGKNAKKKSDDEILAFLKRHKKKMVHECNDVELDIWKSVRHEAKRRKIGPYVINVAQSRQWIW